MRYGLGQAPGPPPAPEYPPEVAWSRATWLASTKFGLDHDLVALASEFVSRGDGRGVLLVANAKRLAGQGALSYQTAKRLAAAVAQGEAEARQPNLPDYVALFLAANSPAGLKLLAEATRAMRTGNLGAARAIFQRVEQLALKAARARPQVAPPGQ